MRGFRAIAPYRRTAKPSNKPAPPDDQHIIFTPRTGIKNEKTSAKSTNEGKRKSRSRKKPAASVQVGEPLVKPFSGGYADDGKVLV